MSAYDSQTPYITSFLVLKDSEGRYAFLKRSGTAWMNGHYGFPAGKVEKGEFYSEAMAREAEEEVGIRLRTQDLQHVLTMHFLDENDTNGNPEWVNLYFAADRWEGEPQNNEPDKHSELAWFSADLLPDKLVPGQREAVEALEQSNTYIEFKVEK